MSTIDTRVSRIADWTGWCSPCEREDRPLVLTRSGPGGLRAWLSGLGDDDRLLLLTCRVCGSWQIVPTREEDDHEVVLTADEGHPVALVVPWPLPRTQVPSSHASLVTPEQEPLPTSPPIEAAAQIPSPRPSVPRTVTVRHAAPDAGSSGAVAAAARVLAAARAQSQRTPSTGDRPLPLDRTRRSRSGPSVRRSTRPAPAREAQPASLQLPPSVALPAGTSQLVLAPAS